MADIPHLAASWGSWNQSTSYVVACIPFQMVYRHSVPQKTPPQIPTSNDYTVQHSTCKYPRARTRRRLRAHLRVFSSFYPLFPRPLYREIVTKLHEEFLLINMGCKYPVAFSVTFQDGYTIFVTFYDGYEEATDFVTVWSVSRGCLWNVLAQSADNSAAVHRAGDVSGHSYSPCTSPSRRCASACRRCRKCRYA